MSAIVLACNTTEYNIMPKKETLSRLLVVAGFVKIKFQLKNKYDAKRKYD